ncbi:MAG: helix-turn-helix transcriptional regulator [Rikenellaceae bacterium]
MDEKGISQTELANLLGRSFNIVNLYATNRVQPPISVLYMFAHFLYRIKSKDEIIWQIVT